MIVNIVHLSLPGRGDGLSRQQTMIMECPRLSPAAIETMIVKNAPRHLVAAPPPDRPRSHRRQDAIDRLQTEMAG